LSNAAQVSVLADFYNYMYFVWVWNRYGRVSATKQSVLFVANLNSFTENNKNHRGMQKGVLDICVVKDGSHIMQYKMKIV